MKKRLMAARTENRGCMFIFTSKVESRQRWREEEGEVEATICRVKKVENKRFRVVECPTSDGICDCQAGR